MSHIPIAFKLYMSHDLDCYYYLSIRSILIPPPIIVISLFLYLDIRYMPEALTIVLRVVCDIVDHYIVLLDFQSHNTHTQCQLLMNAYVDCRIHVV